MKKLKLFLIFNVIILPILFIYNALAYADLISSEEWEISIDVGYGQWTLKESSDAFITTDGEWTYVYGGENVKCPFANATVEISGQSLSFIATGTATASIVFAGYNTSTFTLNVNGTTSDNSGNGNYSISFDQSGWPSTYSGNWQGNFISGGGITTTILNTYYRDSDSDGYGDPESPFEAEVQPSGYVTDNTDCNDYDSTIHPGSTEIRGDGIDQDCDRIDLPKTYSLTQTQVSQLYVSIFGRASEGEGNYYWQRTQDDMVVAANTMLETAAAQRYFGDTLNDNQEFIEFIYENTLGKTYLDDPTGIDFWVTALDYGYSKAQIIASLINSVMDPKYVGNPAQDRFINMVTVSNYCADKVSTVPDVNDLSAFLGFISNVTNDPLTVITAEANVDAF